MEITASPTEEAVVQRKGRPKPKPKSLPKLRDIPPSSSHFHKQSLDEYLAQQVRDKTYDGTNDRDLPSNEIDALALNEIAAAEGMGFFFFLPNRNSWIHQTYDPPNRGPKPEHLGSSIPSLVFMRYTWSEQGKNTFFQSAHRSRYVACDFQLNPPPRPTALYCIQIASGPRYPIYTTAHTSFILLRSNPLYFASTDIMERIIGRPGRLPKGADAEQRLAQVRGIWEGKPAPAQLQQHAYPDLQSLYKGIITVCHPSRVSSSITSETLLSLLPRPSSPEMGLTLGRGIMVPRSKLGGRLERGKDTEGPFKRQDRSQMLIPLTSNSHHTTLLQPNLRYTKFETWMSSIDSIPIRRRVISLPFDALLGRHCFSFGSSRSNDYQLPISDEVAAHHFIMFFNPDDHTLYIRNTSSQGITIYSSIGHGLRVETCDLPVAITPTTRLQIGTTGRFVFDVVTDTHLDQQEYINELSNYLGSLEGQTLLPVTGNSRGGTRKRQNSVAAEANTIAKRHCGGGQTNRTLQVSHRTPSTNIETQGWMQRLKQTFLWTGLWV